jgi:hypothetical protein
VKFPLVTAWINRGRYSKEPGCKSTSIGGLEDIANLQSFQERLLSPRIIQYAKHQLFWECESDLLDEYGSHDTKNVYLPLKIRDDNPIAFWRKIIPVYANLYFTHSRNLLPALAGIVRREMDRRGRHVEEQPTRWAGFLQ